MHQLKITWVLYIYLDLISLLDVLEAEPTTWKNTTHSVLHGISLIKSSSLQQCHVRVEVLMIMWKPFHARLVAEGSAEALREELAELEDARLQLVSADGRRAARGRDVRQLRPSPRTTSQQTEWEVTSDTNYLWTSPLLLSAKQNQIH